MTEIKENLCNNEDYVIIKRNPDANKGLLTNTRSLPKVLDPYNDEMIHLQDQLTHIPHTRIQTPVKLKIKSTRDTSVRIRNENNQFKKDFENELPNSFIIPFCKQTKQLTLESKSQRKKIQPPTQKNTKDCTLNIIER